MASPNAAFSVADGEQLPFNPAPHSTDVTEDFTVEISLMCAQFRTQNSAAAALDFSPTAAAPSAAGGAAAGVTGTVGAVSQQHRLRPKIKKCRLIRAFMPCLSPISARSRVL
jgi:hypothetical protein